MVLICLRVQKEYAILLAAFLVQSYGLFSDKDVKLAIHMMERLSILRCIFVSDAPKSAILSTKRFSEHFLLSASIDWESLQTADISENYLLAVKLTNGYLEYIGNEGGRGCKGVWLVLSGTNVDIEGLSVPYHCQVYAAVDNGTIYEIYNLGNDTICREVGIWSTDDNRDDFSFSEKDALLRRIDLQGTTLKRVAFPGIAPLQMDLVYAQSDILDSFPIIMNFSWELVTGEEDFDVADYPLVFGTFSPIDDMVGPTIAIVINMYVKKTAEVSLNNYFVRPFELQVWATIFLWVVLASLSSLVAYFVYFGRRPLTEAFEQILVPLDALCLQDGTTATRGMRAGLLKLLSRLVAAVIMPAYSAAIISFLTIRVPYFPFKDLKGLVANGKYKLGGQRNSFQISYFSISEDKIVQTIREKFLLPFDENPNSLEDGVEMLCKVKNFVFMGYNAILSNIATPCHVLQIRKPITKTLVGFTLSENNNYGPTFRKLLFRFYNNGVINRRQKRIDEKVTPDDDMIHDDDIIAVSIDLVDDTFIIMLFGIIVALLLLALEFVVANRHGSFKKKGNEKFNSRKRHIFLNHNLGKL